MLPFEWVDEIEAYRNKDGTYDVTMNIHGTDSKNKPTQFQVKMPRSHLDISMSLDNNGPDYKITIEGENYCEF